MNEDNSYRQLELEITELEAAIAAESRQAKTSARLSLGIGAALILVILGFVATNYLHLKSAFSKERFKASLTREVASMSPVAVHELHELGQSLLPIYAAELKKHVEAAWPEILDQLRQEATELSSGILESAHETLAKSERRVLAAVENTLASTYPRLQDPIEQERLRQQVEIACKAAIGDSIASFEELYSRDIARIQNSLFQFDVTDTHESTTDLQKRFIRLWLKLLDQEVMEL